MPSTDIIPQPLAASGGGAGRLAPHGVAAINRLLTQRRVFSRLDWWTPAEWLNSDAFVALPEEGEVEAAMLTVPVSFADIQRLSTAQSGVAWLRWCAVADGVPATRVLRALFDYSNAQLCRAGIGHSFCIIEPVSWLLSYLRDAGFARIDDVVTMVRRDPDAPRFGRAVPAVAIRAAQLGDMEQVQDVDASAFEEQWHYPAFVLRRALATSAYFSIAARGQQVVGYQFANQFGDEAHITRLAVRADCQGQGVGAALMADALTHLRNTGGARLITLNTQASNHVSQRLYRRFGFDTLQPAMRVMRRTHA
jgi:[ribosomal protein S18]-alanine N-acetyltransferase